MKLNKKLVSGMSMNEYAVRYMEALYPNVDTMTVKLLSAITGPKADRDETIALASVLGMSLTERNDKTFIFSQGFVADNWDQFNTCIKIANRHCAHQLRKMRNTLSDDHKRNGLLIAIYNEVYNVLKDRLADTALEGSMIRDKMRSYGYSSQQTLKYESTVKLGGKKKKEVSGNGWKQKNIDGVNWFVKTADTIGAKAVPVTSDDAREMAINAMNELESRYVTLMKPWLDNADRTEEELFDIFCELFNDELDQADVEIFELSPENRAEAMRIADEVEGWIRNGK